MLYLPFIDGKAVIAKCICEWLLIQYYYYYYDAFLQKYHKILILENDVLAISIHFWP